MKLEINDNELIILNQLMTISVELDKKDELFDKNMDADSKLAAVSGIASLSSKLYEIAKKRLKEEREEETTGEESTDKKEKQPKNHVKIKLVYHDGLTEDGHPKNKYEEIDDFRALYINEYTNGLSVYCKGRHLMLDHEDFYGIEVIDEKENEE